MPLRMYNNNTPIHLYASCTRFVLRSRISRPVSHYNMGRLVQRYFVVNLKAAAEEDEEKEEMKKKTERNSQ